MFEFEQPPWLQARVHANNHPSHPPTKLHKTNFLLKIKYKNLKPAIRSKAIVNETIQKKKNTHNHRVQKRCARLSCQYHWLIGSTQTLHRDRTEKMAQNEKPPKKNPSKIFYLLCMQIALAHTQRSQTRQTVRCVDQNSRKSTVWRATRQRKSSVKSIHSRRPNPSNGHSIIRPKWSICRKMVSKSIR